MMNTRHLNAVERRQLLQLCDKAGHVEVLRAIAQSVAYEHPDLSAGDTYRTELNRIASTLDSDRTGLIS